MNGTTCMRKHPPVPVGTRAFPLMTKGPHRAEHHLDFNYLCMATIHET